MMRPKTVKTENEARKRDPYQDLAKTIATIFGGRAISKDKREQKLVARHVMLVATLMAALLIPSTSTGRNTRSPSPGLISGRISHT
jgi:hypothetical protein